MSVSRKGLFNTSLNCTVNNIPPWVFSQGTVCPKQNSAVRSGKAEGVKRSKTLDEIGKRQISTSAFKGQLFRKYAFSVFLNTFKLELLRTSRGSSFHCLASELFSHDW